MVLGRLASQVAKELLKGEEICIINPEEIIIVGSPKVVYEIMENPYIVAGQKNIINEIEEKLKYFKDLTKEEKLLLAYKLIEGVD